MNASPAANGPLEFVSPQELMLPKALPEPGIQVPASDFVEVSPPKQLPIEQSTVPTNVSPVPAKEEDQSIAEVIPSQETAEPSCVKECGEDVANEHPIIDLPESETTSLVTQQVEGDTAQKTDQLFNLQSSPEVALLKFEQRAFTANLDFSENLMQRRHDEHAHLFTRPAKLVEVETPLSPKSLAHAIDEVSNAPPPSISVDSPIAKTAGNDSLRSVVTKCEVSSSAVESLNPPVSEDEEVQFIFSTPRRRKKKRRRHDNLGITESVQVAPFTNARSLPATALRRAQTAKVEAGTPVRKTISTNGGPIIAEYRPPISQKPLAATTSGLQNQFKSDKSRSVLDSTKDFPGSQNQFPAVEKEANSLKRKSPESKLPAPPSKTSAVSTITTGSQDASGLWKRTQTPTISPPQSWHRESAISHGLQSGIPKFYPSGSYARMSSNYNSSGRLIPSNDPHAIVQNPSQVYWPPNGGYAQAPWQPMTMQQYVAARPNMRKSVVNVTDSPQAAPQAAPQSNRALYSIPAWPHAPPPRPVVSEKAQPSRPTAQSPSDPALQSNRTSISSTYPPNMIVDIAQTCQENFPFALIAERHNQPIQKVFDTFSAIIQLPMLQCAVDQRRAGQLAERRMREFKAAKRAVKEKQEKAGKVAK